MDNNSVSVMDENIDIGQVISQLPEEDQQDLVEKLAEKGHLISDIEDAGGVYDYVEMLQEYKVYADAMANAHRKVPYRRNGDKINRNDPCVCGSGKKYKKCCLIAYKG